MRTCADCTFMVSDARESKGWRLRCSYYYKGTIPVDLVTGEPDLGRLPHCANERGGTGLRKRFLRREEIRFACGNGGAYWSNGYPPVDLAGELKFFLAKSFQLTPEEIAKATNEIIEIVKRANP